MLNMNDNNTGSTKFPNVIVNGRMEASENITNIDSLSINSEGIFEVPIICRCNN